MVTVSMTHTTSFMQGCDNPQYSTVHTVHVRLERPRDLYTIGRSAYPRYALLFAMASQCLGNADNYTDCEVVDCHVH